MSETDGSRGVQYCPDCGSRLDSKAGACPECGREVEGAVTETTASDDSGSDDEMLYVVGGAFCLLFGVFLFPFVFVPLGTYLGYAARREYDSTAGTVVMAVGVVQIALGVLLALAILLLFLLAAVGAV